MATIVRTTWTNGVTVINNAILQGIYDVLDTAIRGRTQVTPSTITGDQNNYNPTGLSTAQTLLLASDASRTITGIVAQAGRRLTVINAGAQNIVLAHLSGSSSAANQIVCVGAANLTLNPTESAILEYIDSAGFWRVIAYV